jgi:hypothetical protein
MPRNSLTRSRLKKLFFFELNCFVPQSLKTVSNDAANVMSDGVFETGEFGDHVVLGLERFPELGVVALLQQFVDF